MMQIAQVLVLAGVALAFPADVEKCKYGDEECILQRINYLLEHKSKGYPALNLVSIDPLHVTSFGIKQGKNSPVNIDLRIHNASILGFEELRAFKVSGFGEDLQGPHSVHVRVPVASFVGDYTINGKVLILPINGKGRTNLTITDVELRMNFTGSPEEKDGKTFMKTKDFTLDFDVSRLYMNFTHLFNGDETLSDTMNEFLNDNWPDIHHELKAPLQEAFGAIFESVIAFVFAKYPYDSYFTH